MKQRVSGAIWGIVLILAGVGFAGGAFDLWDFNLFFDGWWTFFIIVPCFASLCTGGLRTVPLIGVGVGVILLLSAQDLLPSHIVGKLLVPFILVALGVNLLISRFWRDSPQESGQSEQGAQNTQNTQSGQSGQTSWQWSGSSGATYNASGHCDYTAIFAGREERITGLFEGADATGIFGSVELDLRDAVIDHDVTINATAIFGGVELKLPRNVRVKVSSTPIMGGISNKTGEQSPAMTLPTVFVNALCVCGGVDIKD